MATIQEDPFYDDEVRRQQLEFEVLQVISTPHGSLPNGSCEICFVKDQVRCQKCGCATTYPGCQCEDGHFIKGICVDQ